MVLNEHGAVHSYVRTRAALVAFGVQGVAILWKRVKKVAGSADAADLNSLSAATQPPTVQWLSDAIQTHHTCGRLVEKAVPLFFSLLFAAADKRPFLPAVPGLIATFKAHVEWLRLVQKSLEPVVFVTTHADCYTVLLPLLVGAADVILFQHQYSSPKLRERSITTCLFLSVMVTFHAINGNPELTVTSLRPSPDDDPVELYAVASPRPMEELLAMADGEAMGRMVASLVLEVGLRLGVWSCQCWVHAAKARRARVLGAGVGGAGVSAGARTAPVGPKFRALRWIERTAHLAVQLIRLCCDDATGPGRCHSRQWLCGTCASDSCDHEPQLLFNAALTCTCGQHVDRARDQEVTEFVVKALWNVSWHPGALKVLQNMGVAVVAEAKVGRLPAGHPSHAAVAKWAPLLFARLQGPAAEALVSSEGAPSVTAASEAGALVRGASVVAGSGVGFPGA